MGWEVGRGGQGSGCHWGTPGIYPLPESMEVSRKQQNLLGIFPILFFLFWCLYFLPIHYFLFILTVFLFSLFLKIV